MTGLSDGELLAATVRGDADAYATLFRRHVSAVTGFAIRRSRNAHEAADLVGDTFLVALEAAPRYREELPTALPWLLGITRKLWMSQLRRDYRMDRLRKRVGGSMPDFASAEEDDVVAAIDAASQRPEIEAALDRLSCAERDVLELVALHGLSPQEAARLGSDSAGHGGGCGR